MAKLEANQIRERTCNEVTKQFQNKIKNLRALIKSKNEKLAELEMELSELKEKNNMQEEWIERMQDFCNMTEEDRNEFFEHHRTNHRKDV